MKLIEELRKKASKLSSDYSKDVFHLVDANGCLICCDSCCGGNDNQGG